MEIVTNLTADVAADGILDWIFDMAEEVTADGILDLDNWFTQPISHEP